VTHTPQTAALHTQPDDGDKKWCIPVKVIILFCLAINSSPPSLVRWGGGRKNTRILQSSNFFLHTTNLFSMSSISTCAVPRYHHRNLCLHRTKRTVNSDAPLLPKRQQQVKGVSLLSLTSHPRTLTISLSFFFSLSSHPPSFSFSS
jgi:hypothetical protein